jgi:hypothetical protein
MNDFQMTLLANERIRTFRAEAERERLARSARRAPVHDHHVSGRGPRRRSLGLLFGRPLA